MPAQDSPVGRYIGRGRYEIIPERKRSAQGQDVSGALAACEWVLGGGPRGADFYTNPDGEAVHLKNWTDGTPRAAARASRTRE